VREAELDGRDAALTRSNARRWNGSSGSTPDAYRNHSAIFRRPSMRRSITALTRPTLLRLRST